MQHKNYVRVSLVHFLLGSVAATLYVLGAHYSEGSDGNTDFAYYIPALVLAVLHIVSTLLTLIIWIFARGSEDYDHGSINRFILLCYYMLLVVMMPWGIVGCVLTGNNGLCRYNDLCYYTVNEDKNYAIAIVIIVLHVVNTIVALMINTSSSEKKERTTVMPTTHYIKKPPTSSINISWKKPAPSPNTSTDRHNTINQQLKPTQTNGSTIPQVRPPPRLLRDRKYMDDMFIGNSVRGNRLHPIGKRTKVDDSVLNYGRTSIDKPIVKPLPPKKKLDKTITLGKVVGKLNMLYNTVHERKQLAITSHSDQENDNMVHGAFRLASSSENYSSTSSDDGVKQRGKPKNALHRIDSRPPPPPYNAVVSQSLYVIPPLPSDGTNGPLPADMYTGTSYPESKPVVIQPTKLDVMRRTSNL